MLTFDVASKLGRSEVLCDRVPDACPICRYGIEPVSTSVSMLSGMVMEIVFRCPRVTCERFFIGRFRRQGNTSTFNWFECVPRTVRALEQSEIISNISPDFAQIFKQAEEAEQHGLLLVCGPGYRKALEFLIKDYLIRAHSTEAENIKKQLLGQCINQYVTNDKVNLVASRAVWLGNDETHYLRKWDTKDLQDLKALIALTVGWIEMEELTEATLKDMPVGK